MSAIGWASVIASCGDKKDDDKDKENQNKLKWDDIKDYQSKFGNIEETFKKFLAKCNNLREDEIKKLINGIKWVKSNFESIWNHGSKYFWWIPWYQR